MFGFAKVLLGMFEAFKFGGLGSTPHVPGQSWFAGKSGEDQDHRAGEAGQGDTDLHVQAPVKQRP